LLNKSKGLISADPTAESIAAFRTAIRIQPDRATAHYNLGNGLVELGKL
jgi:hypothetical protein